MKKRFTLMTMLLLALLAPWAAKAQTTVTIGTGTSQYDGLPLMMEWNYSMTQQIFTAAEIGQAGAIQSIAFDYAYTQPFSLPDVKVYMKNVSKSTFDNSYDMVAVSESDKVFEGTFAATGAGWVTVTLDTPFYYDGTSNLLVCFYDCTDGYPGNSFKFKCTIKANSSLSYYSDDPDEWYFDIQELKMNYSANAAIGNTRNNIQLTFDDNVIPYNVTVSNITYNSANVSWQGLGACFDVRYRKKPVCEFIDTSFEGGTLPPGWTNECRDQDGNVGGNAWTVGQGDGNSNNPITPNGGNYNAKITHHDFGEETYLITPTMDLSGQSGLILYLWYLNRENDGDIDGFGVYYRINNGAWHEIFYSDEAHETWTLLELPLPTGAYAANCQIGFKMYDDWGWGVCLDGICLGETLNPMEWTSIQTQMFTEQLTSLDGYTMYQVQVKNCTDEGEDAWQPPYPLEFTTLSDIIQFADDNVKALCVNAWDRNYDGELNYSEAEAVSSLDNIFQGNSNITSFDELQYFIGLETIEGQAFMNCSQLVSITFPQNLHSIGNYAFYGCNALTSIVLPWTVWDMGENPFAFCPALASITMEAGPNNSYYSQGNAIINIQNNAVVVGCKNTIISEGVTAIGAAAFYGCSTLTGISIPNSVTSIGLWAFNSCSGLTDITIPASVTYMGGNAFADCPNMTEMTVLATTPPTLGLWVFDNALAIVYVPCESLENYLTCNNGGPWGDLTNITTFPYDDFPLVEDFDSYQGTTMGSVNVLPDCWNRINTTTASNFTGYPSIFEYSSYAHSGTNFLFFMSNYNNGDDPKDQYAILPAMEDVSSLTLSLYARAVASDRDAYFEVGVMTNPTDASTFTTVEAAAPTSTSYGSEPYTFSFASYQGTGKYIAFRLPAASSSKPYRGVCIDDLSVDYITVSCDPPVDIDIQGASFHGFYAYFTPADPSQTVFYYRVTESDNAPEPCLAQGSDEFVSVPAYYFIREDLPNLLSDTDYYLWLGVYCEQDETYHWSEPELFHTIPACSAGDNVYDLDISDIQPNSVSFSWTSWGDANQWQVYYSESTEAPGSEPDMSHVVTTNQTSATVEGLDADTDYHFWIRARCPWSGGTEWGGWTNMITVHTPVSCDPPVDIEIQGGAFHGFTVTFTPADPSQTMFYYRVTESNSAPEPYLAQGSGEFVSVPSYFFWEEDLPNLLSDTDYYLWLGVYCELDETYHWSEPELFHTNPTCSWVDYVDELEVGEVQPHSVSFAWNSWGGYDWDAFQWRVYYSESTEAPGSEPDMSHVVITNQPSATIEGLDPDTDYHFWVSACCHWSGGTEWGGWTNMITVHTLPAGQTVTLSAGTNWFSTNVEVTLADLQNALLTALNNASGIKITSQNNGYTNWNGNTWKGSLNPFDVSQYYMIQVPSDCTITLEGSPINPAEHPLTIAPGANWIGFPFSESMTLDAAFSGFPTRGDRISSQTSGYASYNGTTWKGGLTTLEPGQGYIYNSASSETRTFTFPSSK